MRSSFTDTTNIYYNQHGRNVYIYYTVIPQSADMWGVDDISFFSSYST